MFKVISKENKFEVVFSDSKNQLGHVNGKPFSLDKSQFEPNNFHVLTDNIGYNIEVVKINREEKKVDLKINNKLYQYTVKDKFDELLSNMGFEAMATKKVTTLKAPMPGLVIEVLVKPGDLVKKGDGLLILEAMKMENMIKSPADVEVKNIVVSAGNAVEKNQLLIEFK